MIYHFSDCSNSFFLHNYRIKLLLGFLLTFSIQAYSVESSFKAERKERLSDVNNHHVYGIAATPSIDGFSTTTVQAGDNLTIYGSNFNADFSNNIVFIGGIEAIIEDGSSTELIVTVPHGAASPAEVIVLDIVTQLSASSLICGTPLLKINFNGGEVIQNHTFLEEYIISTGASTTVINTADLNADGLTDLFFSMDNFVGIAYRNAENTDFLP